MNTPADEFVRRASDVWRASGRRLTPAREKLCRIIASQEHAFDADKLWNEARKLDRGISVSMVYRAIAVLLDVDLLVEIHEPGGQRSFVTSAGADPDMVYIICRNCRKITTLRDPRLAAITRKIAGLGFNTKGAILQMQVTCGSSSSTGTCSDHCSETPEVFQTEEVGPPPETDRSETDRSEIDCRDYYRKPSPRLSRDSSPLALPTKNPGSFRSLD